MKGLINNLRSRLRNSRPSSDFNEVERNERAFYLNYLREGMTVFDCGANIGELTLLFSRFVGDGGTVHAFEASSEVFHKLETVCIGGGKRNVVLNHIALANKNGSIPLHIYDTPYSSFNSQAVRPLKNYGLDLEPVSIEEVTAVTVDGYCTDRKIAYIDLLKIDVEGAELQVMQGARQMLQSKRIACCIFEFGQTTFDMGNEPLEIENFLKDCNYKIRNVTARDPVFPGRDSVATAKYSMHIAEPV